MRSGDWQIIPTPYIVGRHMILFDMVVSQLIQSDLVRVRKCRFNVASRKTIGRVYRNQALCRNLSCTSRCGHSWLHRSPKAAASDLARRIPGTIRFPGSDGIGPSVIVVSRWSRTTNCGLCRCVGQSLSGGVIWWLKFYASRHKDAEGFASSSCSVACMVNYHLRQPELEKSCMIELQKGTGVRVGVGVGPHQVGIVWSTVQRADCWPTGKTKSRHPASVNQKKTARRVVWRRSGPGVRRIRIWG